MCLMEYSSDDASKMSGYQPRSLREEIGFYQLRLDPAVSLRK